MVTVFDYTNSENNCFIVKHSLEKDVESCIVDTDMKTIEINYHSNVSIQKEPSLILEEYDKFGILQKSTEYIIDVTLNKTNSSVIYKYQ